MARQLILDLPVRQARGRDDFFVAPANALALATLDAPESWPSGRMLLIGPEGAGKSHLAAIWAEQHGASIVRARDLTPELDQRFRAAATTFRRVSSGEADSVKPLRIRIVTVGFGDTTDKLAARMQVPDRHLERFLVLNGLDNTAKLKYGDKVKIISE